MIHGCSAGAVAVVGAAVDHRLDEAEREFVGVGGPVAFGDDRAGQPAVAVAQFGAVAARNCSKRSTRSSGSR